jgi:hypothetical protein
MQVGLIGLGAMGALIVPRLMAAGHTVTGWNRSRDKADALIKSGMRFADTPRAVAQVSEIVFSIVTDAAAVRAVALGDDGIIAGLGPGGIYVDMSTIAPDGAPLNRRSPRPSGSSSRPVLPAPQRDKILSTAAPTSLSVGSRLRNTSRSMGLVTRSMTPLSVSRTIITLS